MESKQQAQLEQAKAFFYSWRMQECYNILRRYFDRLPFQPEEGHAEYIGMFCRVLAELGKHFELKFYASELEKLLEKTKSPMLAYALGFAYCYGDEPRSETAKKLFERAAKESDNASVRERAKMMLAHLYTVKNDYVSAKAIIESVEPTGDPRTDILAKVWTALVKRGVGQAKEALEFWNRELATLSPETDWYAYFSAKVIETLIRHDLGESDLVQKNIAELKKFVEGKNLKSTGEQLATLIEKTDAKKCLGTIRFEKGSGESAFIYRDRKVWVRNTGPGEKLLINFLKRGFLNKVQIIKVIYGRAYGDGDDKLVYYHIHSLRQRLKDYGLPTEALCTEQDGYRLIPEVNWVGEEQ